jgi:hypothetical protein
MSTEITLQGLLEELIQMPGTFILRNEHGSMELRGNDFYLSHYQEWLTIYHTTAPRSSESRSHLHLKWQTFRSAALTQEEGQTPHLAFYKTPEQTGEPPLVWYFPSFYDWANNKAEIPANIAQYEAFVQRYGTALTFVTDDASASVDERTYETAG